MTSDWNGKLADDAPSAAKKKESQADHDAALDDIGAADSDERTDWGGDHLGAAWFQPGGGRRQDMPA